MAISSKRKASQEPNEIILLIVVKYLESKKVGGKAIQIGAGVGIGWFDVNYRAFATTTDCATDIDKNWFFFIAGKVKIVYLR